MKKAVFFDIDGTIVNEKMEIPKSAVEGIRQLKENGHLTFLCTGRSKSNIFAKNLLDLEVDGIVAGCGTYMEFQNEVIFDYHLNQDIIQRTRKVLEKAGCPCILEGSTYTYANLSDFKDNFYVDYLATSLGNHFIDLEQFQGNIQVNKLSAEYKNGNMEYALEGLKEEFEFIIHEFEIFELIPKGHSKATGIQKACAYLGIHHKNTYAFGDSVNDLDMLQYVKHSVAMGNATDQVKAVSDYVTESVENHGIYLGLKKLALI